MDNQILLKRILKLISINYALSETEITSIYEVVGSIDKLLFALNLSLNSQKPLNIIIEELKDD